MSLQPPAAVRHLQREALVQREHARHFRHLADAWDDAHYSEAAALFRTIADEMDSVANACDLPIQV